MNAYPNNGQVMPNNIAQPNTAFSQQPVYMMPANMMSPIPRWSPDIYNQPDNTRAPAFGMNYPQTQIPNSASQPVSTSAQDSFIGRIVGDPSEIKPNEVPMDGRIAIFPTNDLGAVYIKGWNSNGELMTVRYIVDPDWKAFTSSEALMQQQDILRRLENLEKSISTGKTGAKTTKPTVKEDKENG